MGVKYSKETATTICGAIVPAKLLSLCGEATVGTSTSHTVLQGYCHCGSVLVYLIPPPGALASSQPISKMLLLLLDSTNDCYTLARGCSATLSNFTKATLMPPLERD